MNSSILRPRPISRFDISLGLGLLILVVGSSGCASLTALQDRSVPAAGLPSAGSYRVEMSGGFGRPSFYNGSLDGPLTVQSALERSGAIKKYRHMDVTVLRIVEETGRPLKMEVHYDAGKNSISPEQDYALLPGDRIVVESVSHNIIDKVVDSVAGK